MSIPRGQTVTEYVGGTPWKIVFSKSPTEVHSPTLIKNVSRNQLTALSMLCIGRSCYVDFTNRNHSICSKVEYLLVFKTGSSVEILGKFQQTDLVGGFKPSEKYESQLGWLFPIYIYIYGKIKHGNQTTNQQMQVERLCSSSIPKLIYPLVTMVCWKPPEDFCGFPSHDFDDAQWCFYRQTDL